MVSFVISKWVAASIGTGYLSVSEWVEGTVRPEGVMNGQEESERNSAAFYQREELIILTSTRLR